MSWSNEINRHFTASFLLALFVLQSNGFEAAAWLDREALASRRREAADRLAAGSAPLYNVESWYSISSSRQ